MRPDMNKIITAFVFSAIISSIQAQGCNRGHPEGVEMPPAPWTRGCNEVAPGYEEPFFTLYRGLWAVPSQHLLFRWSSIPFVPVTGFIALSLNCLPAPVQLPISSNPACAWQVPADVLLPIFLPAVAQGCHILEYTLLPSFVGLRGSRFFGQSLFQDSLGRLLVTNPFLATVL